MTICVSSSHFIPPARDTSVTVTTRLTVTTSLPRPNLRTKKYCSFINFGLHHYQPTQRHPPSTYVHICTLFVSFAVFIYYFNCISFAIRLSGRKVAIKLIDWSIDYYSSILVCLFVYYLLIIYSSLFTTLSCCYHILW